MEKPFIRIRGLFINQSDIIAIDTDYEVEDKLRIVTQELVYDDGVATNRWYGFKKGSPEYAAILKWLEGQAEVVL